MAEQIDGARFNEWLEGRCRRAPEVKEIVYALRRICTDLGDVREHPQRLPDGRLITQFKLGSRVVCDAHPYPDKGHVGIKIPDADQKSLEGLGEVRLRKNADPWVVVRTLKSIDRIDLLTNLIVRRYEQVTGGRAVRARIGSTAETAKPRPWTPPELELVIKDYFAMRDEEAAGGADQSAHNRALVPVLQNRTMEAVDSIRAQVSHVLLTQGLPYIDGYQPSDEADPPLELLVLAYLSTAPTPPQLVAEAPLQVSSPRPSTDFDHLDRLVEAPPMPAQTGQKGGAATRLPTIRIDHMLQNARNRDLGRAGEQWVVEYEKRRLRDEEHRPDLAEKVEWVADTRGDGDGYDVASFDGDGKPRWIEVKTTGWAKPTPFYLTKNEVDVSAREGKRYFLYRVFAFHRDPLRPPPRLFILPGALAETCVLTPTEFIARVR